MENIKVYININTNVYMYKNLELLGLQRWLSWTSACHASMRIRVQIPRIYIKSQAWSWGWLSRQKHQLQKAGTRNNRLVQYRKQPKALHMMANSCDPSTPTLRCQVETGVSVTSERGPASLEDTSQLRKHGESFFVSKVGGEDLHTHAVDPHAPTHTYVYTHTQTQSEVW